MIGISDFPDELSGDDDHAGPDCDVLGMKVKRDAEEDGGRYWYSLPVVVLAGTVSRSAPSADGHVGTYL